MQFFIRLRCLILGHRIEHVRPLLIGGSLYKCHKCEKLLCIHHGRQQCIDYDADIEKFENEIRALARIQT